MAPNTYNHLSPQALEALNTLEQIRQQKKVTPMNKIVRRISSFHPKQIVAGFWNVNRSASVFQSSPIKYIPQNENQSLASICNSLTKKHTKIHTEESQNTKQLTSSNTERQNIQNTVRLDEPTPFFRDTNSTERNAKCNQTSLSAYLTKYQLQQQQQIKQCVSTQTDKFEIFKEKVMNEMDTVISQFESKKYTPLMQSPEITPIVNNSLCTPPETNKFFLRESNKESDRSPTLSQIPMEESLLKENFSPATNLMNKKKQILNQILSLDNQIKLMQDEEVRMTLNPNKQSNRLSTPSLICTQPNIKSEQLYRQGLEQKENFQKMCEQNKYQKEIKELEQCTFAPKTNKKIVDGNFKQRLDQWVKKKQNNLTVRQDENVKEERKQVIFTQKQCTFSPTLRHKNSKIIDNSAVYFRNQQWQQRLNMKKQRILSQRQQSSSKTSIKKSSVAKSSQKLSSNVMDFTNLIKPLNVTPKHTEQSNQSPRKFSKQIDKVDLKYKQLMDIASKIQCRKHF